MSNQTNATVRPRLARYLLNASGYSLTTDEIKNLFLSEVTPTADDLIIDESGESHWWHRFLSVVSQLRKSGLISPASALVQKRWALAEPSGIEWAKEQVSNRPDANGPRAIRILPMKRAVQFPHLRSLVELQHEYFLQQLPFAQGGCFNFETKGLDTPEGSIVLFQSDNHIVAYAKYLKTGEPNSVDGKVYAGGMYFDCNSIRVFTPVDRDVMKSIWPNFKNFNQSTKNLKPPDNFRLFLSQLNDVKQPTQWIDATEADDGEEIWSQDTSNQDSRRTVNRQLRERRGQASFRKALCQRYSGRCVISGCRLLDVLEAAHIKPYRGQADHSPENGLLLRADLHTLFDLDKIGINPETLLVEIHPDLLEAYSEFSKRQLLCQSIMRPSRVFLQDRYAIFLLRCAEVHTQAD